MKPVKPIKLYKHDGRSKTAFVLSVTLAIVMVVVGWGVTVGNAVKNQILEAKSEVSKTANQAQEQLRQTKEQARPITEQVGEIKRRFDQTQEEIDQMKAREQYILEHIKQQIEVEQLKPYVEEERISS